MKKIIILLFAVFLGTSVFASDYSMYKLDDGQTVIIQQVKNNPIVTIDTWIKTGSINENDQNNGVSHFLEHLFFKGTKTHPPGEFDKLLESKGAITNAATSKDFTHYYITIPSKYFDMAIDLHADMLLNPLIPRKELEKERKVVLEEIAKDANNPSNKVFDNLNDMLYTTHPYKRKVLGTVDIVGNLTREEILDYYNTHYGPQNMVTVIIGDVDPQHAIDKVREDFKTTEVRKLTKNINKPEKQLTQKLIKVDYQPTQMGYLLIGFRGVDAVNPNTYALDVLATILGNGRSSRLYQDLKEQKQLAYNISSDNSSFKEDGLFIVSANYAPEKLDKLQKAIFEEIANIQQNGVSQEELTRAQSIIERDTFYSRESISNISSEIGYTTVLTENPRYYDEYLNNIKRVTLCDVKRVANLYLDENKSAVSIVLPEDQKAKAAATAKPPVQHGAKLVKEIPTTKKYELDNGATMLISQNDMNDIIAISIYAKGGAFVEKVPSTGMLTAATMLKGTDNYSSLELAQIMEEKGIKIQPGTTADSFSIEVLTTKDQLDKTLELLDEVVNRASFDDSEIDKTRTSTLNSIKKSRDVPFNLALEEYKALIYDSSIYSTGPKSVEKNLPKIQRDDILDYYNRIFNPKNIVISVNGNVDTNYLTNKFSDIFNKTGNGAKFDFNTTTAKIPPLTAPKTSVKGIQDLKTAWLVMGWQAAGLQNQKDYATLQVIDTILGSGMSSRLFKSVREQEGLAYQLGSSYSPNVLRGTFTMYIGTNPKTLNFAKEKMLAEVNKLKTEFVSDKELKEAKEKIIGNYIISLETNMDKASTVGWFEASQRGFDFKDKYQQLINNVTASDIIDVANKYFNQNYVTSIVKGK